MRQAPAAFKPSHHQKYRNNKKKVAKGICNFQVIRFVILSFFIIGVVIIQRHYYASMSADSNNTFLKKEDRNSNGPYSNFYETVIQYRNKWTTGSSDTLNSPLASTNINTSNNLSHSQSFNLDPDHIASTASLIIPVSNDNTKKKKRIAYAITITKDGMFQDGAAVLAYSILEVNKDGKDDISLVAFVHPNVTTSRPTLKILGFHVIEVPTPINSSAIKFDFLREKINKNGCCGAAELIKLSAYRLTQYDWVVHLDADTILLNSISYLFDRNVSLIYTTDPNMASFKADRSMPAQGGFLIIKPSLVDYENLIDIMMTTEFRKGRGWNNSMIGWYWGGMTIQGLLPYYYNAVTTPGRSQKIDRCLYNTMVDTPNCTMHTLDEIKSAHFTVCQKPWNCYQSFVNNLCGKLNKRWYELRLKAEILYDFTPNTKPCKGVGPKKYVPMQINKSPSIPSFITLNTHSSLNTKNAKSVKGIEDNTLSKIKSSLSYLRDESPDRFIPIGNTGYIGTTYH